MATARRKKKGDTVRSEVYALRLDPKLRYLAEIAARKQRRSLANFVEWAIEEALKRVYIEEQGVMEGEKDVSVWDDNANLWDLEPSDRLLYLAEQYPELLTYEEQRIAKAIEETVAARQMEDEGIEREHFWMSDGKGHQVIDSVRVRMVWDVLVKYGEGSATIEDVETALFDSCYMRVKGI